MPDKLADAVDVDVKWLNTQAPVQAVGTIDGLPCYFRARGNRWILSIANTPDGEPTLVDILRNGWCLGSLLEGAGYMSQDIADECLRRAVAKWISLGGRNAEPMGQYAIEVPEP